MSDRRAVLVLEADDVRRERYRNWLSGRHSVETAGSVQAGVSTLSRLIDVVVVSESLLGETALTPSQIRNLAGQCTVVVVCERAGDYCTETTDVDGLVERPVDRGALVAVVDRFTTRTAYERGVDAYYELASTKARLETELDRDHLDTIEDYHELSDRFQSVERDLDALLTGDEPDWTELFRTCLPGSCRDGERPVA